MLQAFFKLSFPGFLKRDLCPILTESYITFITRQVYKKHLKHTIIFRMASLDFSHLKDFNQCWVLTMHWLQWATDKDFFGNYYLVNNCEVQLEWRKCQSIHEQAFNRKSWNMVNKTQLFFNWPYSSVPFGPPENKVEIGILKVCNLVMSALRTKMIYWSLHHMLLFSTTTQNHSCLAHNSDMQTSSVPSICSAARNTEHTMFSALSAMTGEYSAGWAEKKGRKRSSVACVYIESSSVIT